MSYGNKMILEQRRSEKIRELGFICYNMAVSAGNTPGFLGKELENIRQCSEALMESRRKGASAEAITEREKALGDAVTYAGYTCYNFYVDGREPFEEAARICREIRTLNMGISGVGGSSSADGAGAYKQPVGVTAQHNSGGANIVTRDIEGELEKERQSENTPDASFDEMHMPHPAAADKKERQSENTPDASFDEMHMPHPAAADKNMSGNAYADRNDMKAAESIPVMPPEPVGAGSIGDPFYGSQPSGNADENSFRVNFPYGMEPIPEGFIKCKCGYRNRSVASYCGKCGKKLSKRGR